MTKLFISNNFTGISRDTHRITLQHLQRILQTHVDLMYESLIVYYKRPTALKCVNTFQCFIFFVVRRTSVKPDDIFFLIRIIMVEQIDDFLWIKIFFVQWMKRMETLDNINCLTRTNRLHNIYSYAVYIIYRYFVIVFLSVYVNAGRSVNR